MEPGCDSDTEAETSRQTNHRAVTPIKAAQGRSSNMHKVTTA
eukprot:CAMPEP_0185208638 /NCGR_PEP_ID=MMETSP1140-20130426/62348_1 /TAXON_ID=298111 /ORGANISM="Pavlova sp., Strain CCMP459" /LENGTH=41 /DNA_ID= /DNA_START= /DNA_END= /DNA_ORIENTATION=